MLSTSLPLRLSVSSSVRRLPSAIAVARLPLTDTPPAIVSTVPAPALSVRPSVDEVMLALTLDCWSSVCTPVAQWLRLPPLST